jgi:hypothetical protein
MMLAISKIHCQKRYHYNTKRLERIYLFAVALGFDVLVPFLALPADAVVSFCFLAPLTLLDGFLVACFFGGLSPLGSSPSKPGAL